MAEDHISRTDMVRREALAEAVHWASHRSVPQTLEQTLQDAETIEKWLLGETPAATPTEGPPPGTLFVLSAGETNLEAARRRRGWTPQEPGQTSLEHWQELKRLDALLLEQQDRQDRLWTAIDEVRKAIGRPYDKQAQEDALVACGVAFRKAETKTEGAPVCSSD